MPDIQDITARLWDSADELRANSGLKESEYSVPMLGLIFLKYADRNTRTAVSPRPSRNSRARRQDDARSAKPITRPRTSCSCPRSHASASVTLPEGANLGQAVNDAMAAIQEANEDLRALGSAPLRY